MLIATWNVNSLRVRLPQLKDWLATVPCDVIGLQEIKLPDDGFPASEFDALGLHYAVAGQKTYNGVALLARSPIADVTFGIPGFDDPQRRVIAGTISGVRVISAYVPNGQTVGSDKYAYKLDWLARFADYVTAELSRHPLLAVVGDYNIAPEDRDVHDPRTWEGSVHVSPAEREALRTLMAPGLVDVFRRFDQPPGAYSWWDYRMGAFRRNHGLRIDLILASAALAERCVECRIDRAPRTLERPSDHTPVLATFDIR